MLTEGDAQIDAEEESTGQLSIWRDVYTTMRCPGLPCQGPHCWIDPIGKKHYKLKTHHLKSLIRHVGQGHELRTHKDILPEICQQLYAEEQQRLERHQKQPSNTSTNLPPINIILPELIYQPSNPGSSLARPPIADTTSLPLTSRLEIPGLREKAVEEYCTWQQSKTTKLILKAEY